MEANAGEYIKNYLHLKRFPRISLHCKLVPVQYWEYEYGLLWDATSDLSSLSEKTRKSNHLQMKLQRQHFLLSYLKTLSVGPVGVSNSRPPASQPGAQPSEQPVRRKQRRDFHSFSHAGFLSKNLTKNASLSLSPTNKPKKNSDTLTQFQLA